MEKKAKVPKLRFPGFIEEWEQCKLGEVATLINRTDATSNAPIMMISAASGFISQSEKYSNNNAGNSLAKYIVLKKGELAYNHGASKQRQYGSCFALNVAEARIPFVYHCFSVGDNNPNFIGIELNDSRLARQLRRLVSSGARMDGLLNISFAEYKTVDIFLPCLMEQNKVAAFFAKLDNLITLHQRKLIHLQTQKKSLLQKMFPKKGERFPELCFPGFTDAWEQRKFGDIAIRNSAIIQCSQELPSIEYEDIVSGEGTIDKDIHEKKIRKTGIKFEPKDVLFGKLRPYLQNWFLPDFFGVAVGDFWVLHPSEIDSRYLYYLIQTPTFQKVANQSTGTKMPRADWNLVSNALFFLPKNRNEQAKIGFFLQAFDNLITLHQRKLTHLKTQKKALLQQMFV